MKSIKPQSPPTKRLDQRLKQLADPTYMNQVKQGKAVFEEYEAAKALLAKWQDSDARGTPTEIDLRDERLAHAQQNFDAAEAKLRTLRGDYGDGNQTASPSSAPDTNSPAPLTTGDIAYSFSGLHWPSVEAWKKPLADKPKWLRSCVAIPGSRGRSETRWNPVLIGAALVRDGHAKPNSVRAKFQTIPLLQPWLESWKTYEADNLSAL